MRLPVIVILTLLALGGAARADDLHDFDRQVVAQYLASNPPIIKGAQTPADVVRVWQDMVMVKKMIFLEVDNALPIQTRPQLVRRIDAARSSVMRAGGYDDWQVALLADITLAFASTAAEFREGRTPYATFGTVSMLLTNSQTLARQVEAKYAKPGTIIPPEATLTKW